MTREEFEKQIGNLEEYVLTYDPFMGPQVTDLDTGANFCIGEEKFEEILNFFREFNKENKQ